MKKYISCILMLCSSVAYSNCPTPLKSVSVDIKINPIDYHYEKTSLEISKMEGESNHSYMGLYFGERKIEIEPTIEVITNKNKNNSKKLCAAINKIEVKVTLTPNISIAKETQELSCMNEVVNKHELKHYQFEVNALTKSKVFIENLIKNNLSENFYIDKPDDMSIEMKIKSESLIKDIKVFLTEETTPLHKQIDTNENYYSEFSICSQKEHNLIIKMLQN